jgi:hypothetical protein
VANPTTAWQVASIGDDGGIVSTAAETEDAQRPAHGGKVTQRSPHKRGRCPVCKRLVALTADEMVPRHNGTIRAFAPPEECPGGGQQTEATES